MSNIGLSEPYPNEQFLVDAIHYQPLKDVVESVMANNSFFGLGNSKLFTGDTGLEVFDSAGSQIVQFTVNGVPVCRVDETGFVGLNSVTTEAFFETVAQNLKSYEATINYSGDNISDIVYDLGGGFSITKTLNYTGDDITSIVLSGDTPLGILLTKTLTYTSGNITGIAYS